MKIFRTIGLIILITTLGLLLFPWFLRGLGYYVDNSGGEIAKIAAEKRNPDLCDKIIVYSHILGPTSQSRRNECIYTYAEITKDPSACELLMPSSYGLSCVGGAQSEPDRCSMSNGEVRWEGGSETYEGCANLRRKRTKDGDACCLVARVAFVKSENDCSSLKEEPDMHDECLKSLAFKNHEPAVCAGIANANTKNACIVNAEAIKKNPSICSGCKVRVEKLDQLK